MAQKSNLNVSPYYDDFDPNNNFYKVLFNPGFPVQARELTTSQSILQNQIEDFGSHIFKQGSVVIPGNITFDNQYNAVKLNTTNFGIDISVYLENFVGKTITGKISNVSATVEKIALPSTDPIDDITIYVKYIDSGNNFSDGVFTDGEALICNENIIYGNTTISANTDFASLISENATSVGSAASLGDGVFFIRGYFVKVSQQTLILDYYTNTPSYRVGLQVTESFIGSKDDSSLFDNAKGFTNFAAPGADRLKITLNLTKKLLTDLEDTDFVEILRVDNGKVKKIKSKTRYNQIRDYLAERTFDESGNYTVRPFIPSLHNSLNDRVGTNGIYFSNQKTDEGNTPSDDLACIELSPGKAYVRGYEIDKPFRSIVDIEKTRDTESITNVNVPFQSPNKLKVNRAHGTPKNGEVVQLFDELKNQGSGIGSARVYGFNLTDAAYTDDSSNWDLHLYDIQTYTKLIVNTSKYGNEDIPRGSFIEGNNSGASGFAVDGIGNSDTLQLRQTSGSFVRGESLSVNGVSLPIGIGTVNVFDTRSIKSVKQNGVTDFPDFSADVAFERFRFPSGVVKIDVSASGIATAPVNNGGFKGVRVNDIIRYFNPQYSEEVFNRVSAVSNDGKNLTLQAINAGVTTANLFGALPTPDPNQIQVDAFLAAPVIDAGNGLIAPLPDENVSSVDLQRSNIILSHQVTLEDTDSDGILTVNTSDIAGITSVSFTTFDEERYSVHRTNGINFAITDDTFSLGASSFSVSNLPASLTDSLVVNTTIQKNFIKSKKKVYNRSQKINVTGSRNKTSGISTALGDGTANIADGLTFNNYFGLRVQDKRISLNYPDVAKVIAVYESVDGSTPTLDVVKFSPSAGVSVNALIGENVIGKSSNSIARVVANRAGGDANSLEIVYLNSSKFVTNETVTFDESNIETTIESITIGNKKDLTNSYKLDKGQNPEFYDYSSIIRNSGVAEPSNPLLIIFDYYSVPSTDSGDLFTVLSYDEERYATDIPNVFSIRASDTLDFRPRVDVFSATEKSPFDFDARTFTSSSNKFLKVGEGSVVNYNYYLPRIDKLYLDTKEQFIVEKGTPSRYPKPPKKNNSLLEIAQITLPAYLYNPQDAIFKLVDNRRYTMKDIGGIDKRVKNLEDVTSLSLLELDTKTLQIQDSQGNSRFKTGFFVDDFKNRNFMNLGLSKSEINPTGNELIPIRSRNSLKIDLAPADVNDNTENFALIDSNVQKTGRFVTLKYDEIGWIEQPFATGVENVNPFHVVVYTGDVELDPANDIFTRTIQLEDNNISRTVNREVQFNQNIDLGTLARLNRTSLDFGRVAMADRAAVAAFEAAQENIGQITAGDTTREDISSVSRNTLVTTDVSIRNILVSSGNETFMRSRNTEFFASALRPKTRYYQFLDGRGDVDVIPKLIEIKNSDGQDGSDGVFQIGETVVGSVGSDNLIRFRVASPNHKKGIFNNPSETYSFNPYAIVPAGGTPVSLPTSYSQTSTVLNVDTKSLSEEAIGSFFGYITLDMKLVGQTSGAIAYVKDIRLISDVQGDLVGTFFLRDPNVLPTPPVRIENGTKTFKLSSDPDNNTGLVGSSSISTAEVNYISNGSIDRWQNEVLTTDFVTDIDTTTNVGFDVNNLDVTDRVEVEFFDPLAQTFVVGGNIEAPSDIDTNDDIDGAFLTAVEVYFAKVDPGNLPVTIQVRTTSLGIPTRDVLGTPVVLNPNSVVGTDEDGNDILLKNNTSTDGSKGTKVTFPEPIFLPPGREYAIVLLSDKSMEYEVWIATMNEATVNTQNLPNAEQTTYSTQFSMGALFRSQNGSLWTENQYQDMKFKLYKANFTSNTGTAVFYNPSIVNEDNATVDENTLESPKLLDNPIQTLPKTGFVGVSTIINASLSGIVTTGRKIHARGLIDNTAVITGVGASVLGVGIMTGGLRYDSATGAGTEIDTYPISTKGTGLKLKISGVSAVGNITTLSINSKGEGYQVGDIVGIVTSQAKGAKGGGAEIVINSVGDVNRLYLTNIQGSDASFTDSINKPLQVFNPTSMSLDSSILVTSYTADGGINDGKHMKVNHFDNGLYTSSNKSKLSSVEPSTKLIQLPSSITASATLMEVGAGNTSLFAFFEGSPIGAANTGYVKLGSEIIGYETVGADTLGTLTRGVDNTIAQSHGQVGVVNVQKYELNGVSLRRINGITNTVSTSGDVDLDSYFLSIDMSTTNGTLRSTDLSGISGIGSLPALSFNTEKVTGGKNVHASRNIMFGAVVPSVANFNPGSTTSSNATIRTVTARSVGGTEVPFLDMGFENVTLNEYNALSTPRLVASKLNEDTFVTNLPRNKSFTLNVTMINNGSPALSPVIRTDTSFVELINHRINNPVGSDNYATSKSANSILDDPHAATYVSKPIKLSRPATSLRVILSAYRDASADFRVLYSLNRADSDGVNQEFELFPGYKNLIDSTENGFGDQVVDTSKNDGRPDSFVPASLENEFLEYQFTAENLDLFTGFTIKIVMFGTNQARPPRFKDLRTIAVR